jgi:hypothetical protein
MSPSWRQRRKEREAAEAAVDDEPMAMLDLSAYDLPPERHGAFRDAVAERTGRSTDDEWAKAARDLEHGPSTATIGDPAAS